MRTKEILAQRNETVYLLDSKTVPIWEKSNLTIAEAAEYYNIGQNKLRELTADEHCPFVIWIGNKRLIKRKPFDEFIANAYSI
ncbi:excisionase [Ruminococcus albus]|uniref:DNA binding domain-containing protein, excisionase family n=1 Tax=Ruminococcus albus TaxID=1264 RepID=A0A1H7NFC8_RUMAL|nr:excisionase [Ruminococcus albus]SEL22213.1 DNA binding domain-containing protein, excisionase family [Ruminococcus albus]